MTALNRTISLKGKSGKYYTFNLFTKDTKFEPLKAIYLISNRSNEGKHKFLYIGKTEDLSIRFNDHHKQKCFENNGYNCIGIMQVNLQSNRDNFEKDLILYNTPLPCNNIFNS